MPDILHRVGISASAENIFRALSEEKGLAGWWTVNVRAEPTNGSALKSASISTKKTAAPRFSLPSAAGKSLEFMHYCSTKWATYLLSLKKLCEVGEGTAYPDDIDID